MGGVGGECDLNFFGGAMALQGTAGMIWGAFFDGIVEKGVERGHFVLGIGGWRWGGYVWIDWRNRGIYILRTARFERTLYSPHGICEPIANISDVFLP